MPNIPPLGKRKGPKSEALQRVDFGLRSIGVKGFLLVEKRPHQLLALAGSDTLSISAFHMLSRRKITPHMVYAGEIDGRQPKFSGNRGSVRILFAEKTS